MFHLRNYYENEMSEPAKTPQNDQYKQHSTTKSRPRQVAKSRPKSYHRSTKTHSNKAYPHQVQRQHQQSQRHNQQSKHTFKTPHRHGEKKYTNRHEQVKSRIKTNYQPHSRHIKSRPRDQKDQNIRYENRGKEYLGKKDSLVKGDREKRDRENRDKKYQNRRNLPNKQSQSKRSDYEDNRKSYRSTNSNYTTMSNYTTESESFVPPLSSKHQETPQHHIEHQVKSSAIPNLNLSTYGYSVNGTDTTRQKALYDAVMKEGVDAVRNRIVWLLEKYADKDELVDILSNDFDWLEKYNTSTSLRERFDSQREHIKQKIHQRMQEKSKSRRRSLKDYYRH